MDVSLVSYRLPLRTSTMLSTQKSQPQLQQQYSYFLSQSWEYFYCFKIVYGCSLRYICKVVSLLWIFEVIYLIQNKLWLLPLRFPKSATLLQLSSPLLSLHSEESEEGLGHDGNEVILALHQWAQWSRVLAPPMELMDDSEEK
jgi:hypothetical protein